MHYWFWSVRRYSTSAPNANNWCCWMNNLQHWRVENIRKNIIMKIDFVSSKATPFMISSDCKNDFFLEFHSNVWFTCLIQNFTSCLVQMFNLEVHQCDYKLYLQSTCQLHSCEYFHLLTSIHVKCFLVL
jgi:hypothetical protein